MVQLRFTWFLPTVFFKAADWEKDLFPPHNIIGGSTYELDADKKSYLLSLDSLYQSIA